MPKPVNILTVSPYGEYQRKIVQIYLHHKLCPHARYNIISNQENPRGHWVFPQRTQYLPDLLLTRSGKNPENPRFSWLLNIMRGVISNINIVSCHTLCQNIWDYITKSTLVLIVQNWQIIIGWKHLCGARRPRGYQVVVRSKGKCEGWIDRYR